MHISHFVYAIEWEPGDAQVISFQNRQADFVAGFLLSPGRPDSAAAKLASDSSGTGLWNGELIEGLGTRLGDNSWLSFPDPHPVPSFPRIAWNHSCGNRAQEEATPYFLVLR